MSAARTSRRALAAMAVVAAMAAPLVVIAAPVTHAVAPVEAVELAGADQPTETGTAADAVVDDGPDHDGDQIVEPAADAQDVDGVSSSSDLLVPGLRAAADGQTSVGPTSRSVVALPTVTGQAHPGAVAANMQFRYSDMYHDGSVRFHAPAGTTIDQVRSTGGQVFTVSADRRSAVSGHALWHSGAQNVFVSLLVGDGHVPGDVLDGGLVQMIATDETVVAQADLVVEVTGHLEIITHPSALAVLEGARAEFSSIVSGYAPQTQWQVSFDSGASWEDVDGATASTLVVEEVPRPQSGFFHSYRAVHSNIAGTVVSDAGSLSVAYRFPAAHGQAAPGDTVELRVHDSTGHRAGIMQIAPPAGTTIVAARNNMGVPFTISDDGSSATTTSTYWGAQFGTAWVTLRVDDDVALGSVLDGGTAQVVGEHGDLRAQADLSVTVTGEIEIIEHPADVTVDVGSAAELTAPVSGHGVTTQWQVSTDGGATWGDIEGATGTTLTLEETTPEMNRSWYRAVHTNSAGQAVTDHAVLLVRVAPYFITHPTGSAGVPGGLAFFRGWAVDNSSPGTLDLSWEFSQDGETWMAYEPGHFPEQGATINSLQLGPVTAEMDGFRFRAVAENHLGRTVSDPALLTVHAAPVIDPHPADVRTLVGHDATFSASTPAVSPHRTQQWQERAAGGEWTDIPGATDPTYATGPTTLDMDQREYRIVFTNHHGSTTSEHATLTVRAPLTATVTATPTVRLVDQLP